MDQYFGKKVSFSLRCTVLLPETVGSAAAEQKGQAGSEGPGNPPIYNTRLLRFFAFLKKLPKL